MNVVGQTKATEASIQLREERHRLVLEIEDNGKKLSGRDISGPRSLALLGMRERATKLDGRINVVSRQGKGTFVGVRIPLRRQEEPAKTTTAQS